MLPAIRSRRRHEPALVAESGPLRTQLTASLQAVRTMVALVTAVPARKPASLLVGS
jgi:hypothetical protein